MHTFLRNAASRRSREASDRSERRMSSSICGSIERPRRCLCASTVGSGTKRKHCRSHRGEVLEGR